MAKIRKRKKIAEVVSDPINKKEAPIDNRSDEKKVFDMGFKIPRSINDKEYDNSPGEVQENIGGTSFGVSDYRLANQIKQEDEADKLKPGKENKPIPDYTQYTATNESNKSTKFWNESSGIYRNSMAARKGVEGFPSHNQPTLLNPTGEGYRGVKLNDNQVQGDGSRVANIVNKPKEEYSKPSRKGDENIFPSNEDKPKEDMGKQQSKVSGDGSKAAEVVSTPKVENTSIEQEEPPLGGNAVTIDAGTNKVTTTGAGKYVAPGQALTNAIDSNKAAETTGNAVLKAGIDNAETANQVFEAPKVADDAKKEAEKMQSQLDVNTVNTVNAMSSAMNNMSADQKQAYGDATQNQLANQTAIENQPVAPAAYNAVTGGTPIRPSYDQIATKDQVTKDIAQDYQNLTGTIPQAVVEKLGVQDYYPEIGRDIAVGTFSGSRIGSQTIYSGAGGLLPMGLYDARKRALNEAAKTKQAALDKYYSGIDIAAQFKPKFDDIVNNRMDNLLYNKHKGNVSSFLADPESRKEFSRLESVSKNVNYYDTWASSILKDSADNDKFIDPEQVKIAQEIKRAFVEDLDGVLNGEKDMSALFAKAHVYQNIVPQLDKVLKEALDPNRMGESPINMRTGDADGKLSNEEFIAQRNDFMKKLNDGTLDQAHYISGFKKFFTGDYERIIDGLVQSGKYSALQKDAAMNYVAGQLQEQFKLKNDFVQTGALGAMRLAEDKRQFNAEYARKIKEGQTPWVVRNDMMSSVNPSTGRTIQQEFIEMKKQGLTGDKLKNKMLQTARDYGFSGATWDPHTKSVIIKENATPTESGRTFRVNPSNTQSPVMMKVFVVKNGKKIPKTITANDLAKSKPGTYFYQDGKSYKQFNQHDINLYDQAIKTNQLGLKTQYYESSWGSVGSQTGKYNPLNTDNIGDYSLNRAINMKQSVGSSFYLKPIEGDPNKFQAIPLPGTMFSTTNISDENSRRSEDARWGDDRRQFGYTMQGGTTSESSGSQSYSNE